MKIVIDITEKPGIAFRWAATPEQRHPERDQNGYRPFPPDSEGDFEVEKYAGCFW